MNYGHDTSGKPANEPRSVDRSSMPELTDTAFVHEMHRMMRDRLERRCLYDFTLVQVERLIKIAVATTQPTSSAAVSAEQRAMETDAQFVERMSRDGLTIRFSDGAIGDLGETEATRDFARLVALARLAPTPATTAGEDEVRVAAQAIRDFRFPPTRATGERCRMIITQAQAEMLAGAVLAALSATSGFAAGMMRAAEIAKAVPVACNEHIAMRHMIVQAIKEANENA